MLKILICDDDLLFSEVIEEKIKRLLQTLDTEYTIAITHTVEELENHLKEHRVDVLFLDIMLGETNSVEWVINSSLNRKIQVVFMTSFPAQAYDLSEAGHCYYLIKGHLNEDRLKKAILRAIDTVSGKNPNLITVKTGSEIHTVDLAEITFVESLNNNVTLHFYSAVDLVIYSTLKKFSAQLTPNFLQCHKSFVVNLNHVVSCEPHKFTLSTGAEVPIPPKKHKGVLKKYEIYINNF